MIPTVVIAFIAVFLPYYPQVSVLLLIAATALVPFVYRKLRLLPMLLPRCACCGQRGEGFSVLDNWPRITCRCFKCEGEFGIWLDGKVGSDETWETPVLVLKWPYTFGPYRKVEKPKSLT